MYNNNVLSQVILWLNVHKTASMAAIPRLFTYCKAICLPGQQGHRDYSTEYMILGPCLHKAR